MFYASDHGESLGEKGIYLHGLPYFLAPKAQTHVPIIFWASDDFKQSHKIHANQNLSYSHDNLSHTLLGLFNVKSRVYDKKYDMFSPSNMK